MTAEELEQIENDFEHRVGAVTVGDMRRLIAEVRRLHGIQKILADCREESSAWADGYRTAAREMEVVQKALRDACDSIIEHNAEYSHVTPDHVIRDWRGLADRVFTPESSLAKQRQTP